MQHNSQKFSKTERPRATEEMFSFGCGYSATRVKWLSYNFAMGTESLPLIYLHIYP